MRIVQFTDTHLLPDIGNELHGVDTYVSLKKSFHKAMASNIRPDAVFVTGDIAEDGSVSTYLRFKEIFAQAKLPVFVTLGNHDDAAAMHSVFKDSQVQFVSHTFLGDWLFIFANSQVPAQSYGFLEDEELMKIKRLAEGHSDKWVILSLHHPPLSPCPASGCQLKNATELLNVLSELSNLRIVLSGHLHTEIDEVQSHMRFLTAPSTFALGQHPNKNQELDFENFWASHSLDKSRQGFRILDLMPNGKFVSEIHWL